MISKENYISDLMYEDGYLEYYEALEMWDYYRTCYEEAHELC
jgi:hypothetical protein